MMSIKIIFDSIFIFNLPVNGVYLSFDLSAFSNPCKYHSNSTYITIILPEWLGVSLPLDEYQFVPNTRKVSSRLYMSVSTVLLFGTCTSL